MNLYFDGKSWSISPHQVLICDNTTSTEDIFIFIFRCLQYDKRFDCDDEGGKPIYTLLFPEQLNLQVLEIFS